MTTIYVSNNGNDANNGLSISRPKRSITSALSVLSNVTGNEIQILGNSLIENSTTGAAYGIDIDKPVLITSYKSSMRNIQITSTNFAFYVTVPGVSFYNIAIDHTVSFFTPNNTVGAVFVQAGITGGSGLATVDSCSFTKCVFVFRGIGIASAAQTISIDDCRFITKSISAGENSHGIRLYRQDGNINITNNQFEIINATGKTNRHFGMLQISTDSDGYTQKRNGLLTFTNNLYKTSSYTNFPAIYSYIGSETIIASGNMWSFNISNNTINSSSYSMFVIQPNDISFFNYIGNSSMNNNIYNNEDANLNNFGLLSIFSNIPSETIDTTGLSNLIDFNLNTRSKQNFINSSNRWYYSPRDYDALIILNGINASQSLTLSPNINDIIYSSQSTWLTLPSATGTTIHYDTPVIINAQIPTMFPISSTLNIVDISYVEYTGITYGTYTGFRGTVCEFDLSVINLNTMLPITDFTSDPIQLTFSLYMANTLNTLRLYKFIPGTKTLMNPQPSGYPVVLSFILPTWTASLTSLSEFIIIDDSPPAGVAGGDPHVISVQNIKTLLPNEWKSVRLYEFGNTSIIGKCDFIHDSIISNLHRLDENNQIIKIDPELHSYVKDLTYFTELYFFYEGKKVLSFDMILGSIIENDNIYKVDRLGNHTGLYSITHNCHYPPRNIIKYCVYFPNKDHIEIAVDTFWDDINHICLFTNKERGILKKYIGEFFRHNTCNDFTLTCTLQKP